MRQARAGGFHRDPPPLFDLPPVRLGGARVYVARPADGTRRREQLFGQGGFARVHMGEQADVADLLQNSTSFFGLDAAGVF